MLSKWYELKTKAIALRKKGLSVREIELKLGVPRSTLSGWLKSVTLSTKQQAVLRAKWKSGLVKARSLAASVHRAAKQARLAEAEVQAQHTLNALDLSNFAILELAFSMIYLGEGFKTNSQTGMGNSDPLILQFFVSILHNVYKVEMGKIKCELHLRADQNVSTIRKYWSDTLGIPLRNFTSVSKDMRTVGSPTYKSYKGVCVVRCGHVEIQRKVIRLARLFAEKVVI